MLRAALIAVTLALSAAPALAALTEIEERIVAAAKARSGEAIELLERAVRINSGTLNPEGVREVGRLFAAELEALGFETRWAEMPAAMQRAGHLVATRTGTQGRRVLLLGHLDTVFEKQSPMQLWERSGDIVRGQGVVDMKGGNVVMVEALRALHSLGLLEGTTVTVVLTGDEERVGAPREVARRDLVEAAKRSDVALSFEGVSRARNGGDLVNVERRASGGFSLRVTAMPGHSSGMFSPRGTSLGAIYEGARSLPGTNAEISFREAYPPMMATSGNRRLLEAYLRVSEDAGYGPVGAITLRCAGRATSSSPRPTSIASTAWAPSARGRTR